MPSPWGFAGEMKGRIAIRPFITVQSHPINQRGFKPVFPNRQYLNT
jgi:hypothetical protein